MLDNQSRSPKGWVVATTFTTGAACGFAALALVLALNADLLVAIGAGGGTFVAVTTLLLGAAAALGLTK